MFNITNAFAAVWDGLEWAVTWLRSHGVSLTLGEEEYTVTYLTLFVSAAVISLICSLIPIFGEDDNDE